MKKILAILIFCSISLLAQNSDKYINSGQNPSEQKMLNNIIQKTLEGMRVIVIGDSSQNKFSFVRDSLVNVDTITVYNNGQYLLESITITDTSSSLADSVVAERYDTTSATWDTASVGMKDLFQDIVLTSNILVPGKAMTRTYLINESYPFTWRFRRINTISGTTYITIKRAN